MVRAILPFFGVLLIAALGIEVYNLIKPLDAPLVDVNQYWGPGAVEDYVENTKIRPQEIYYTPQRIAHLRQRLNESKPFQPTLETVFDEYGINIKELREIIAYWRDEYLANWTSHREGYLNQFPHFVTEIQGLNIHFVHVEPTEYEIGDRKVVPLLLLHGWPGTIREFFDLIPFLVSPELEENVVFEIIVPSLPGFGWSEGARKPGLGVLEMAVIFRNLMLRLGHEKFYVQGGDWGSMIGSAMATVFPDNVIGYHSNLCALYTPLSFIKGAIASLRPSLFIDEEFVPFVFPIKEKLALLIQETGFLHLQATKPDTIGAVLTDHPIGLAAYILEKYSHFFETLDKNAILDNLTIYAITNSITTSMRLYAEAYSVRQLAYNLQRVPTNVPTGCARFPKDVGHTLDWQLRDKYPNLIHSTYHKTGGHFAAMEVPIELANDIIEFVRKVEQLRST